MENEEDIKNPMLPADTGFKVPENYFQGFEDTVMAKLKQETVFPNEAFTVPEQYFDTLEDKIMAKVQPGAKIVPLKRNASLGYWMAAASVLLIAGTGLFLYRSEPAAMPVPATIELADVPASEISEFAANADISDEELLLLVSEHTLDSLNRSYAVNTTIKEQHSSIDEEASLIQDEFSIEADEDIEI